MDALPRTVRLTKEPTKYSTHDDAARWMRQFEMAALLNGWSDAFKFQTIELYMTGVALQWVENMQARTPSWEDLKRLFLARFDIGRIAKAKQQLRRLVRDEGTSLLDHLEQIEWLCHQVDQHMTDSEIIEYFANTISPADFADIAAARSTRDIERLRTHLQERARHAATCNQAVAPQHQAPLVSALTRPDDARRPRSPTRRGSSEGSYGHRTPPSYAAPNRPPQTPTAPDAQRYGPTSRTYFHGDRRAQNGGPLCNHCNRAGHIMKYCRDRASGMPPARPESFNASRAQSPGLPTSGEYRRRTPSKSPHRSQSPNFFRAGNDRSRRS